MRLLISTAFLSTVFATALAADELRAGFAGVGAVRIGMTTAELQAAWGRPVAPEDPSEAECYYVPRHGAEAFSVMIVDGKVARIDVSSPLIPTLRGARVGDTVDAVRKLYGSALGEQPHFYGGLPDLYLTFFSSDRRYALRFETHEGVVSRYYPGYAGPAQYVEGCL